MRRDLRLILIEVMAWSLMVGWGETYLVPFALALGVSESASGLVLTVPLLLGAVLQLATPWAVERAGSFRRWVVGTALLQGLCYLPLVVGAWFGWLPIPLLLVILVIYWSAGLSCGPAWMTWVDTVVPARLRARYFSRRSRYAHAVIGTSLLASGWVLQRFTDAGSRFTGFACIFLVAGASRLVSGRLLSRQRDVVVEPGMVKRAGLAVMLRRDAGGADGLLLLYLLLAGGALHLAHPFLAALMLRQNGFSYVQWVGIAAAPFLAKIVVLPWLGRLASRRGALTLLWVGGVALVPVSVGWIVTTWYPLLLVLAIFSGVAMAAQNLAAFLLLLETIRNDERTAVMTSFNLAFTAAMAVGSALGAQLLSWLGEGALAYQVTFGLSTLLQLATLLVLSRFARAFRPRTRSRRDQDRVLDTEDPSGEGPVAEAV